MHVDTWGMRHRISLASVRLLVGLAVVPALVLYLYGGVMVMPPWWVHFYGVGATALVAAVAALTLTAIGARRRDPRTVVVAGGFTIMATFLAVHGFFTPGVLVGMNGVVAITGSALEGNPTLIEVRYASVEGLSSGPIAIEPLAFSQFVVDWSTTSVPDGDYTIAVMVVDRVDGRVFEEVRVSVRNARLSIDPLGLSFSDPEPEDGEEVTVWLQVRNTGDADATGVTVEFFVLGELEHTVRDLTVPARTTVLVHYRTTVRDGDTHSARAFSDLHGTGEVSRTITTREAELDEEPSGNAVWSVALLALFLSTIALVTSLMKARRPTGKVHDQRT